MATVTLKNDFHNTSVRVRVPANGVLSASQYRRVCNALCGMADCKCGTVRGRQDVDVQPWQDRMGRYSYRLTAK